MSDNSNGNRPCSGEENKKTTSKSPERAKGVKRSSGSNRNLVGPNNSASQTQIESKEKPDSNLDKLACQGDKQEMPNYNCSSDNDTDSTANCASTDQNQSSKEDSSKDHKGFIELFKNLAEALKAIGGFGSVFVLICNDISFEYIWSQPVEENKGTEKVLIGYPDESRDNKHSELKKKYLYLNIINAEDKMVSIGDTYRIEVFKYGKWRELPIKRTVGSINSVCKLGPKESEWRYYDTFAYGDLEPGLYRIALSSDATSKSYYYFDFYINDNKEIELPN